jgi:hypothetical protein
MSNEAIYDLYKCKNLRNRKSVAFESQHGLIDQYQIKELFWKEGADCASKEFRTEIWDSMNNERVGRINNKNIWMKDLVSIKLVKKDL